MSKDNQQTWIACNRLASQTNGVFAVHRCQGMQTPAAWFKTTADCFQYLDLNEPLRARWMQPGLVGSIRHSFNLGVKASFCAASIQVSSLTCLSAFKILLVLFQFDSKLGSGSNRGSGSWILEIQQIEPIEMLAVVISFTAIAAQHSIRSSHLDSALAKPKTCPPDHEYGLAHLLSLLAGRPAVKPQESLLTNWLTAGQNGLACWLLRAKRASLMRKLSLKLAGPETRINLNQSPGIYYLVKSLLGWIVANRSRAMLGWHSGRIVPGTSTN